MKKSLVAAWIALTTILFLLLFLFGPWSSHPSSTLDSSTVVRQSESVELHTQLEADQPSDLVPSEIPTVQRTDLEVANENLTVFEVREVNGDPVTKATILICRGQSLVHSSMTDSFGNVEFPSDHTAITLVISVRARPVSLHALSLTPGRFEIILPLGNRLAGKVIQADGAPPSKIRISLRSDHPLFDNTALPQEALEEIGFSQGAGFLFCSTLPDGSFQFADLPDGWSGFLQLPHGHTILRANSGRLTAAPSELRLEAPPLDLFIELAKPANIRGRLVTSQSLIPIHHARLSALFKPLDGRQLVQQSTETDENGDFTFQFDPAKVASLNLFFGSRIYGTQAILLLETVEVPPNGDLGLIKMTAVRPIHFVMTTHNHQPIALGIASAAGIQSKPTNVEGEGVLPWVPKNLTRLRFVAPGFVPMEQELNDPTPDPLVVVMEAGNRLEVELVPPAGVAVSAFRVKLKSDSIMIHGPAADLVDLQDYVEEKSRTFSPGLNDNIGHSLVAQADAQGLAVFQSIKPNLKLDLEIHGIIGGVVYYHESLRPLEPEESRRHVVDLTNVGRVFSGKVTDLEGHPLVRATVQLGGQILSWTNNSGEFSCLVQEKEPNTLVLSHQSSAILFVKDYVVPYDGLPVEFRLQPALRVIIEVKDEAGNPISDAQVSILNSEFSCSTHNLGGGRFETGGLSSEMVRVQTMVAGRYYLQDLNPAQPIAQVVVPVHGSLIAAFTPPSQPGQGQYSISLKSMIDEDWVFLGGTFSAASLWLCEFPRVCPGNYEINVHYSPTSEEKERGITPAAIGNPITLRIESGQASKVNLE